LHRTILVAEGRRRHGEALRSMRARAPHATFYPRARTPMGTSSLPTFTAHHDPASAAAAAVTPGQVSTPLGRSLGPVRIGDLVIDPPLFPRADGEVHNIAFRRIARRLGCGMTAAEKVMAGGSSAPTLELAKLCVEERPGAVQIAGGDPAVMGEAAARLVDQGADVIDVNMGCPVRKIVDRCAGSALLRDPSLAAGVVEGIVRRVKVPVTVKVRAGWDDHRQCIDVAKALEAAGAAALSVHGRTREQQYSGRASRDAIRAVKEAVRIPVIGNGDVTKPQDVIDMVRETGVDGVMIGRAALWDPWIFAESARALRGASSARPTPAGGVLVEYFTDTAAIRGKRTPSSPCGVREPLPARLRRGPAAARAHPTMDTREDFFSVIDGVFEAGVTMPTSESFAE
jgi:nifR3 family TIM-barrel protein